MKAAGTGALRSRRRALPESATMSGFIRKTMHAVSEIIAREGNGETNQPTGNTDLKTCYRDGWVRSVRARDIHGTLAFRDLTKLGQHRWVGHI